MLDFLKKKKEDKKEMSTLEQVRKAYEDLSDEDKQNFKQSIADRVHESVGEQEAGNGDKDIQTDTDREHEAIGTEQSDEQQEDVTSEVAVESAEQEEKEELNIFNEMKGRIDGLETSLSTLIKQHETLVKNIEGGEFGSKSVPDEPDEQKQYGQHEAAYRKRAGY